MVKARREQPALEPGSTLLWSLPPLSFWAIKNFRGVSSTGRLILGRRFYDITRWRLATITASFCELTFQLRVPGFDRRRLGLASGIVQLNQDDLAFGPLLELLGVDDRCARLCRRLPLVKFGSLVRHCLSWHVRAYVSQPPCNCSVRSGAV